MQGDGPAECQRNCQLSCTNPCLGNRECERTGTSRQRHLLLPPAWRMLQSRETSSRGMALAQRRKGLLEVGYKEIPIWATPRLPKTLHPSPHFRLHCQKQPPNNDPKPGARSTGGTGARLKTVHKDVPVLSIAYVPFIAWHIMYYSSQSYAK